LKITFDIPQAIRHTEPGSPQERLLELVCEAHYRSAMENANVSSAAVVNCARGNPVGLSAIASAILSLGAGHGPVAAARGWIYASPEMIESSLNGSVRIPGFGNSFFKEGDPKWFPVRDFITENFRDHRIMLEDQTAVMLRHRPHLYPNAARYTAICADEMRIPRGQEEMLLILPRMPAWFQLAKP